MRVHLSVLVGGLCAAALTGAAQVSPKRIEVPSRTGVPARSPSPANPNPFLLAPAQPASHLPSQTVSVQPRLFNLDTSLARLFADMKSVTATGEFELSVTNAGKVEVTTLPLTLHLIEGRVRTELDLSALPMRIESTGPFASLRNSGINRVTTLTMSAVNMRLTQQLFPDAKVESGRLYYCTQAAGFADRVVTLDDRSREAVQIVADTVGDALTRGFLPAAPKAQACLYCDYRVVCGPFEEQRTSKYKSQTELKALIRLRELE